MRRLFVILVFSACAAVPAVAQIPPPVPDMSNRIPAPLPPPAPPPIINGPIPPEQQLGNGLADPASPRQLKTFNDRASRCLQQGSSAGLHGRRLDSYTRSCANDF